MRYILPLWSHPWYDCIRTSPHASIAWSKGRWSRRLQLYIFYHQTIPSPTTAVETTPLIPSIVIYLLPHSLLYPNDHYSHLLPSTLIAVGLFIGGICCHWSGAIIYSEDASFAQINGGRDPSRCPFLLPPRFVSRGRLHPALIPEPPISSRKATSQALLSGLFCL